MTLSDEQKRQRALAQAFYAHNQRERSSLAFPAQQPLLGASSQFRDDTRYRPTAGVPDYTSDDLGITGSPTVGTFPPVRGIGYQNELNYGSYASPVTHGGWSLYSKPVIEGPPTSQFQQYTYGVDIAPHYRGGYSSGRDPFAQLYNRYAQGAISQEEYDRQRSLLNTQLAAPRYSGVRMPPKANKRMLQPPVRQGVGSRTPATEAFPSHYEYASGEEYDQQIRTTVRGLALDSENRQSQVTLGQMVDRMVRTTYGNEQRGSLHRPGTSSFLQGQFKDALPRNQNVSRPSYAIPESDRTALQPYFEQAGWAVARSVAANAGSIPSNQPSANSTFSLLDIVHRFGAQHGIQNPNYSEEIRHLSGALASMPSEELLRRAVESGAFTDVEKSALVGTSAIHSRELQAKFLERMADTYGVLDYRKKFAEFITLRSLNKGTFNQLHPDRAAGEAAQVKYGPVVQRIESMRGLDKTGSAFAYEFPSALTPAKDHDHFGDSAAYTVEGGDEDRFGEGMRTSRASDRNSPQAQLSRQAANEVADAFSILHDALGASVLGTHFGDYTSSKLSYANGSMTHTLVGRSGEYAQTRASNVTTGRFTTARNLSQNVIGTGLDDMIVGAAMIGSIAPPSVSGLIKMSREVSGHALSRRDARYLSEQIWEYRVNHSRRVDAVATAGDYTQEEIDQYVLKQNDYPSTANQALRSEYTPVEKYKSLGGFQPDPLALVLRQSSLASDIPLNRKEREYVSDSASSGVHTRAHERIQGLSIANLAEMLSVTQALTSIPQQARPGRKVQYATASGYSGQGVLSNVYVPPQEVPIYPNGKSLTDILSQNTSEAPLFEGSASANVSFDDYFLNKLQGIARTSPDNLSQAYGVDDPALARILHQAGSYTNPDNLRQALTWALQQEFEKPEYQDISRRRGLPNVVGHGRAATDLPLHDLVPSNMRWLDDARLFAAQGNQEEAQRLMREHGMSAATTDPDFFSGVMAVHAVTRTGNRKGFGQFLDERGRDLNIYTSFPDAKAFEDWQRGTALAAGHINGIGSTGGGIREKSRYAEALMQRIGNIINPVSINNEQLESDARTPALTRFTGHADERFSNVMTSVAGLVSEAENRAARIERARDAATRRRLEVAEARRGLTPDVRKALRALGVSTLPTNANRSIVDKFLRFGADEYDERRRASMPRYQALQAVSRYWKAQDNARGAREALRAMPLSQVNDALNEALPGRRILAAFNDADTRSRMAQFVEGGSALLAQTKRGVAVPSSDDPRVYSMQSIRSQFEAVLKDGSAQAAQRRLYDLVQLSEEFWNGGASYSQDMVSRLAGVMGARTTYLGQRFGSPRAHRSGTSNFVFGPEGANHEDRVFAAMQYGLAAQSLRKAALPSNMRAEDAAGRYRAAILYDNPEQLSVMHARAEGLTVVNAGAGTGKTTANVAFLTEQAAYQAAGMSDAIISASSFSKAGEQEISKRLHRELIPEDRARIHVATLDADARRIYSGVGRSRDLTGVTAEDRERILGIPARFWNTPHTEGESIQSQVTPLDRDSSILPIMDRVLNQIRTRGSQVDRKNPLFQLHARAGDMSSQELLERVQQRVQEKYVGGQYLQSLRDESGTIRRGTDPRDVLTGYAMLGLHTEYARTNVADFDYMKVAAAQLLEQHAGTGNSYQPHNTIGSVDESQDTRLSDLHLIRAMYRRGLMVIGDDNQNIGAEYRNTLLSVGNTLKAQWAGTINPDISLKKSLRQGAALVSATNAMLGSQNEGDSTPGREGTLSYTAYNHTEGLASEIQGQVRMFKEFAAQNDLSDKSVAFVTKTNRGVDALMTELTQQGFGDLLMRGTATDSTGKRLDPSGRIIVDTIHGVKGQTHDLMFGIGFGEGDMNITSPRDDVLLPEDIRTMVAAGEGNRGQLQKAFMANVGLSRSNTIVLSGSGAPSRLIQPAIDTLHAMLPSTQRRDSYTLQEAIGPGRGSDITDPAMIAQITLGKLLQAAHANTETALMLNHDQLLPADFQLQKGAEKFQEEEARRVLAKRPSELSAFLDLARNRHPLDLPKATISWNDFHYAMRAGYGIFPSREALGIPEGQNGLHELHVRDSSYVGGAFHMPTGVIAEFTEGKNTYVIHTRSDISKKIKFPEIQATIQATESRTSAPDVSIPGMPRDSHRLLDRGDAFVDSRYLFSGAQGPWARQFSSQLQASAEFSDRPNAGTAHVVSNPESYAKMLARGAVGIDLTGADWAHPTLNPEQVAALRGVTTRQLVARQIGANVGKAYSQEAGGSVASFFKKLGTHLGSGSNVAVLAGNADSAAVLQTVMHTMGIARNDARVDPSLLHERTNKRAVGEEFYQAYGNVRSGESGTNGIAKKTIRDDDYVLAFAGQKLRGSTRGAREATEKLIARRHHEAAERGKNLRIRTGGSDGLDLIAGDVAMQRGLPLDIMLPTHPDDYAKMSGMSKDHQALLREQLEYATRNGSVFINGRGVERAGNVITTHRGILERARNGMLLANEGRLADEAATFWNGTTRYQDALQLATTLGVPLTNLTGKDLPIPGLDREAVHHALGAAATSMRLGPGDSSISNLAHFPPAEKVAGNYVAPLIAHQEEWEYFNGDRQYANQNVFSGNLVIGEADFRKFITTADTSKDMRAFEGVADMGENGDLNVSMFRGRRSLSYREAERNRYDRSNYVFALSQANSDVARESQITGISIPSDEEARLGIGIHYDPRHGTIAAAYGNDPIDFYVQQAHGRVPAHELLAQIAQPIESAGTDIPNAVAPKEITGNAYTRKAQDYNRSASPDQLRAFQLDRATISGLVADAGTGKTFSMVGRALNLLASGMHPSELTFTTFTTKATEEFRNRMVGVIGKSAADDMHIQTTNSIARDVVERVDPFFLKTLFGDIDPETMKTLSSSSYVRAEDPHTGLPNEYIAGDKGWHPGNDVMLMWETMQNHWGTVHPDARATITAQAMKEYRAGQYSHELDSVKVARYMVQQNNTMLQHGRFAHEQLSALKDLQEGGKFVDPAQTALATMALHYQKAQGERNTLGQEEITLAAYQSLLKPANSPANNKAIRDLMSQFGHTLIDEAQDLTPVQMSLLQTLANGRGTTVAGDEGQAIYRWRGAQGTFVQPFGIEPGNITRLQTSRRNKQGILNFVNRAFGTSTQAIETNKDGGRVSYDFVPSRGRDNWKYENQHMADDLVRDLESSGGRRYLENPDLWKEIALSVPTHSRVRDLKKRLEEPLGRLGVGIKIAKSPEELDQQALRSLRMREIPEKDSDEYQHYLDRRREVQSQYDNEKGVMLTVHPQIKGLEFDRLYAGGMTGEGSGQIITHQLAKKLGDPAKEDQNPDLQAERREKRNMAYVVATRPRDALRMYGSGTQESRLLSGIREELGLSRKLEDLSIDPAYRGTANKSGKSGVSQSVQVDMPPAASSGVQDVRVTNAPDVGAAVGAAVAAKLPETLQKLLEMPREAVREFAQQQGVVPVAQSIAQARQDLTDAHREALAQRIPELTNLAREQGRLPQITSALSAAGYSVGAESFRPVPGTATSPRVPMANFDVGSRHGGGLSSVVGWLAGAEQAGHMTMTLYERNLKAGSEYDYLASRAALAMGTTRARVDSYAQTYGGGQAFGSSGIRGISMMDVAEVQRYVSDPTQVSQIAMFARMAGMNPGAASRDVRQLGKQFNLQSGVVANIVAGSRNTGGTLDEQELLAAAQYAAPFAANQSNTRTPQGKLANVLAMSQALADYGIDVDRGTRMLMQHMAMPDLTMAVRMKQVHDYRGRQAQPNVTQAELDRTFTSETYWQDQLQVAQMRNYNASTPYRLLEQRVSGGLDTQGRSLMTPTSGPVSYADKVMQAPLAQLSSAGLDFRQMKVNLDFEAKNLQRQSSLLDIQERMQARDIQIQRVGLGIQGLGLRQGLEMLGLRREEFGLQRQANQLDLQDTRLDVQTMQIRGQYAQETSDLQYQKANIEYAARQRDLRLQQRMLPVQAKQLDVTMEAQAASISWQEQGVAFKRWYDTQMYGAIGADRSYRAYLATQQGAADEGRAAGYSTTAAQSLYGRTQQQVGQVPVMGLQNEQFYAGIQHQLAQLQYGRTAFRSEASYSENVQYIKKQTEFYERRMAVEDKAREFSYRMADEQLAIAKKQYEVQKELLGFQKEQLQNQIADAERLIPIEQRLNELNHLIETAEIKQLPERIAIALGKLQIKEQQIPLAEKMTAKQLANEEAMLRAQGAQLALSLANLADQEKQNKEQMALRRAELENAKKNLEFREEQARREGELLQAKQIQIELSYKLAQREAEIYTYLEASHTAVRDKGLGTESGKVMDFTEFAKTIADMVKNGRLDKGVLDQMTSSWTDPALVAAVKAAMDGTLDRYEKDILAKADAAVSAGGKTEIDRAYGQITQQGGFEYAEFEKTLQAQQIAMKHAADSTNDLVFALEKFKGALGEATGALHGPGGELGSIAGIGKDLAQLFLNLKLVRTIGAGAVVAGTGAEVGAGLAAGGGAVVAGSVSTVVAAAIGIITGGVGLGLIADSAWKYISGKYLHDQLGDMLLGKDSSTGILDTRQDAQTNQALTEWNKTERPTYQIALAQRYAGTDDNLGDPLARAIYDRAVLPSLQPYLDSARNAGFGGGGGSGWGQDADMKAALTDAIQKAAPNDPALPVLQQVLATLSSDGFAAGALPAIARNVQMLSDLTDQNDTEATRNLQAILKQANDQNHALQQLNGLGGTTNKTLALHSITLQKLEKSGFDTVDSIKATNRDIVRNAKLTGDVVATQERMIKELSPIQKGIDRSALVAQQQKAILLDLYGGQSEQTTILKQGFKGLVKDLADKLANGIKDYADQRQKQQGDIPKYDIGAQEITRDQLAFLHRGEAVLTPNEAAAYRAGLKTAPEQSVQASIERAPLAGNMDKPQGATYHIESIEIHNDIRGEISEETLRKLKKANTESIIEALKKVTNR